LLVIGPPARSEVCVYKFFSGAELSGAEAVNVFARRSDVSRNGWACCAKQLAPSLPHRTQSPCYFRNLKQRLILLNEPLRHPKT
jgi:hypothetical protein